MAYIPYRVELDVAAEKVAQAIRGRRGRELLNIDRILLHCPAMAEGWSALMGRIRQGSGVPALLRELAICAVASMTGADYEWHHHAPLFLSAGGTADQLGALAYVDRAETGQRLFNAAEQAVLSLAMESTRDIRLSVGTVDALKGAFSAGAIVELMLIVASYNMVSRVLVGLGVDIECRSTAHCPGNGGL